MNPFIHNVWNKQIHKNKVNCGCQGKKGREVTANGQGLSFSGDNNVLKLEDDNSTTEYTKTAYLHTSK